MFIRLFRIMSHVHCIFFAFEIKRWNGAYNNLSLMRFVHNIFQFYSNKNLKWFSKRFPIERISSKHYIFGLYFIVIAFDRYKPQITNNFWVKIYFSNTVYVFINVMIWNLIFFQLFMKIYYIMLILQKCDRHLRIT